MSKRASWAWAITIFLLAALLGMVLIKAGAERRVAEQRLEAARVGANALDALEQGLARAHAGLDTLAAEIRARHGVENFPAIAALAAEQGSTVRNWFFIPRGAAAYVYSLQAAKPGIDLPTGGDWHTRGDDRGDAMRSSVVSFCPDRAWAGDAALWLRRPVVFTRHDRGLEFSGWVTASLDVQKIVLPAVLRYHQGPRFHAVLWCSDTASGLRRIVDRSADVPTGGGVDVFIPNTARRWGLSLSPTLGRQPTTGLIQHGILVFILAVVAGLAVFEACRRIAQLTREVAYQDDKLNSSRRLLIEEKEHRQELEKQFSHSGFQDALTGLPNRRFFIKQLGNSLYQTRMRQRNFTAVLVVELDRFKTINDSLGHAAGDELLIQSAQRFAGCMKPAELVVARLRGSEFAMLLGDIVDEGAALETARSLQRMLADPFHIRGQSVFTGATIGVTLSGTGFEQPEELLRSADVALSRARSEGQGRIVLVDAAALDQASSLQQLETDLHRAI
ncbi:MAG: diguanylate cyclase domain-containing protein, partial [Burkholderiales bacterium]